MGDGSLPGTEDHFDIQMDAHIKEETSIWFETLDDFKEMFPNASSEDLKEFLTDRGANARDIPKIVFAYNYENKVLEEEAYERQNTVIRMLLDS